MWTNLLPLGLRCKLTDPFSFATEQSIAYTCIYQLVAKTYFVSGFRDSTRVGLIFLDYASFTRAWWRQSRRQHRWLLSMGWMNCQKYVRSVPSPLEDAAAKHRALTDLPSTDVASAWKSCGSYKPNIAGYSSSSEAGSNALALIHFPEKNDRFIGRPPLTTSGSDAFSFHHWCQLSLESGICKVSSIFF